MCGSNQSIFPLNKTFLLINKQKKWNAGLKPKNFNLELLRRGEEPKNFQPEAGKYFFPVIRYTGTCTYTYMYIHVPIPVPVHRIVI